MLKLNPQDPELKTIISHSGLIAYPTEAIYGLGCHPQDSKALERLLDLKKRDASKGFILIAATLSQVEPYINVSVKTKRYLEDIYPGFITVIVERSNLCPRLLTGQFDSIAIRISNHPVVKQLCESLGHPLVSTSANLSGEAPIRAAQAIEETFAKQIDALVLGELGGAAKPSQIIDLTHEKPIIIRE